MRRRWPVSIILNVKLQFCLPSFSLHLESNSCLVLIAKVGITLVLVKCLWICWIVLLMLFTLLRFKGYMDLLQQLSYVPLITSFPNRRLVRWLNEWHFHGVTTIKLNRHSQTWNLCCLFVQGYYQKLEMPPFNWHDM